MFIKQNSGNRGIDMDYLKRRTLIIIIAVVLLGSALYGLYYRETDNIADSIERNVDNLDETVSVDDETESVYDEESENSIELESKIIFVDIDGAINNPGTFQLPVGTRLCTLIETAGGLEENADTRFINRAEKLYDEQKVYIPEKGEEIVLATISANGDLIDADNEAKDGIININTATTTKLESLPGIGEVIAARIIEYRENEECFSCIEDIKKVSGIADGKFNQIKDQIKVK
jgi:competence protein ComEA